MASRAGIPNEDLEFIQFHPTGKFFRANLFISIPRVSLLGLIGRVGTLGNRVMEVDRRTAV